MAAGDLTITRGVGFRDDQLTVTQWSLTVGAGITSASITTDGDTATLTGTWTASSNSLYVIQTIPGSLSNNTYGRQIWRYKDSGNFGSAMNCQAQITYTDSSQEQLGFNKGSTISVTDSALTLTGRTFSTVAVVMFPSGSQTGTFSFSWDFLYFFKETLTLPAVSSPLTLSLQRYVVELPIPTREGGVLQDLGSASAQLEVDGTLITTTSPNNYTGEQWWDVLVGTWLEANWQFLRSDRVAHKYQIEGLTATQDPGKVGYYGFKMRLRKVDIITAGATSFGSNTGTGAIQ